jgi:hypothetical protein
LYGSHISAILLPSAGSEKEYESNTALPSGLNDFNVFFCFHQCSSSLWMSPEGLSYDYLFINKQDLKKIVTSVLSSGM